MKLRIITDEGTSAVVTAEELPELFEAFEDWQRSVPRSLKEVARWDEVLRIAQDYMEDDGTDELVNDVTPA